MQHVRDLPRWLLAVALASCLGAAVRAAPPAVEALQRAEELYRTGDLLEAEPLYQAATRAGRGQLRRQAYDRLLTLYARMGRPDRAVQTALAYQPLLAEQGDRARLQQLGLELGRDYLALGHYAEAEAAIQGALADRRAASALPRMRRLSAWADLARIAGHRRDRPLAAERWAAVERLARAALDEPRLPAEAAVGVGQQPHAEVLVGRRRRPQPCGRCWSATRRPVTRPASARCCAGGRPCTAPRATTPRPRPTCAAP